MTFKVIIYFLAVLSIFLFSCSCKKNVDYVEYVPTIVEQKHGTFIFTKKQELATKKHLKNIKKILHFYNYSFIEKNDGKILIPETLNLNKELLVNFTKKANDTKFIDKIDQGRTVGEQRVPIENSQLAEPVSGN